MWLLAEGENVVSPIGEISCIPENVHFPSRNPKGTDAQFAAKRTPKNFLMFLSTWGEVKPELFPRCSAPLPTAPPSAGAEQEVV